MKKMYLVLTALVIASVSFSQVGVQVIGNAGSVAFKSPTVQNAKTPLQAGFGAGVVAELHVTNNFSIKPSLNFLQKKNSIEFENAGGTTNVKATLNYAELPLDFVYTIPMKAVSVYIGAGPSISYGISGNMKYKGFVEGDEGQIPADETVKAFEKEEKGGAGLSRYDVSINAIAGLKFSNGLFLNAGYLGSLRNLAAEDGKYKLHGFQLTLGYLFTSARSSSK